MFTWSPSPPLAAFVRCFWLLDRPVRGTATERVLPHGLVQLIINLDRPNVFVTGPRSEFTHIHSADTAATIGVLFKPGGSGPFLGVPTNETYHSQVALDSLWGTGPATELRERLLEVGTPSEVFLMLEQILLEHAQWQWCPPPGVASALALLEARLQDVRIPNLSARSGLGPRRFTDVFSRVTGMPPKRFCRVRRFQQLVAQLGQPGQTPWSQMAIDCGYFDQPHMASEFRALSGLTLSEYITLRTAHQNHVREPGG